MLRITYQDNSRLVIQDRRVVGGIVAFMCALISVSTAGILVFHIVQDINLLGGVNRERFPTQFVFALVSLVVCMIGVTLGFNFLQGISLIFDRTRETVQMRSYGFPRPERHELSIYSVVNLIAEFNQDIKVYGVFLVTRHGERLPVATLPPFAQEQVETILYTVRQFLRQ